MVIRDTLRNLLYSWHTLLYLHCRVVVQFQLGIQDQSPSQHCNFLPYLLIQRYEELKMARWQSVLSPGRCILLSGTKIPRLAKHKVKGIGMKNFASESLRLIVSAITPISTTWFLDLWILAIAETVPYIGCWYMSTDSDNIQPSIELFPSYPDGTICHRTSLTLRLNCFLKSTLFRYYQGKSLTFLFF